MALYLVDVTFTLPVEAESEAAAVNDAREDWAEDELNTNGLPQHSTIVAYPLRTAGKWGSCLPWGGDGGRTIEQILAAPLIPGKPISPPEHKASK